MTKGLDWRFRRSSCAASLFSNAAVLCVVIIVRVIHITVVINAVFKKGQKWRIADLSFNIEQLIDTYDQDFFSIVQTLLIASHPCFPF